jgi:nucleotide-binding universal stress UspA family protein
MLNLILVPLDRSSYAEQALPWAVMIAKREHADLELVHVYEMILPELTQNAPPLDPTLDLELHRRAREWLETLAEQVHKESNVSVKATLLEGAVEEELAAYIEKRHADLVAMSTHGTGGISHVWLGDTANDLAQRSYAPVLLVKPKEGGSSTASAREFRHVLIPLDGSRFAEEAIDHAVVVAGIRDVEFVLVNVLPPFNDDDDPIALLPEDDIRLQAAKDYLEELVRNFRSLGVNMSSRAFRAENTARAILDAADRIAADLIAMETHGEGGVKRLIMGGVADKVLRASKVPVLMHRPHFEERTHAKHDAESSTARESRRS